MVSVTISEGSLKVDAELLLERLRNTVKEFKDFFRLNLKYIQAKPSSLRG